MQRALVGYTGFVGSNICAKAAFDGLYNTKNIEEAYGTEPDLLIYAGLRAEKYLANTAPEKDMALIEEAEENIRRIRPRRLVLISTIDVFKDPAGADEDTEIVTEGLHPYGYNRYRLEEWVRADYPDALIIRLPGLFGQNIKKNFIYDYIHVLPFMLRQDKFTELSAREPMLLDAYEKMDNGFYRLRAEKKDAEELKACFLRLGFSALNFTDSRSRYQFYDLSRLAGDIERASELDLRLWHPATEPVSAGEVYEFLCGGHFVNELPGTPAFYDYRTKYAEQFGGQGGYIMDKRAVLSAIREFVQQEGA